MTRGKKAPAPPTPTLSARRHLLLGLVFLLALAFRGVYLWGQAQHNPLFDHPIMDARLHDEWARQVAAGQGLGDKPYFRAPLYIYVLGGVYKLFGPSVALARILGGLLGAISCYLIARLGTSVAGFGAGLLAGVLAAVYWPFAYFDTELLTVGLEVFLNLVFLLLLLRASRQHARWLFFVAGLVWGLSAITRPTVLTFVPGFLLWLWLVTPGPERLKRWAGATLLTGLGGALAVLPVTIRNYVVGNEFVLIATNGGVNFYIGNNPQSNGYTAIVPGTRPDWWGGYEDTHRIVERELGRKPTEGEVSRYWAGKAWDWIGSEPGKWVALLARKFRLFWSPVELPNNQPIRFFTDLSGISVIFWIGFPVAACLGLAGLVFVRGARPAWILLIAFCAIYMLTIVMFFCNARYRLPVVPVLLISAALGLVRLVEALKARRLGRPIGYLGVAVITAGFLATNPPKKRADFRRGAIGEGHYILGLACTERTPPELERAIAEFSAAIQYRPNDPDYRERLALALVQAGRAAEAVPHLQVLLERRPKVVQQWLQNARTLVQRNQPAAALRTLRLALLGRPDYLPARLQMVVLLTRQADYAGALAATREGLRRKPDEPNLLTVLAWLLATVPDENLRDGEEALRLAQRANQFSRRPHFVPLDTLAAAYAEVGRFDDAVATARQALELARGAGAGKRVARIEQRLRLYEQRQPCRDPAGR